MNRELINKLKVCGVDVSDDGVWLSPVTENNYALCAKAAKEKWINGVDIHSYDCSKYKNYVFAPIVIGLEELEAGLFTGKTIVAREDNHHVYHWRCRGKNESTRLDLSLALDGQLLANSQLWNR